MSSVKRETPLYHRANDKVVFRVRDKNIMQLCNISVIL